MYWPLNIRRSFYPGPRDIWARVRILHETSKAVLVDTGVRIWVPKSAIRGIRLRGDTFEIRVSEKLIG